MNESGNAAGSVTVALPKRAKRRRRAPLTTNQMVALFREVLEKPLPSRSRVLG